MPRITRGWNEKLARALAMAYDGMRVSGNAFWISPSTGTTSAPMRRSSTDPYAISPCWCCTCSLTASRALDVARAHQFTVVKRKGAWELIETPELKQAKEEIKKLNEE